MTRAYLCIISIMACAPIGISSATENGTGYQVPPQLDDGWQVNLPEEIGLKREHLAEITRILRAGETYPNVHALLIVKDGRLVYEELSLPLNRLC